MKVIQIILFLLTLCPLMGMAQEKYTDKLPQRNSQGGAVILHEDEQIDELVNGTFVSPAATKDTVKTTVASAEEKEKEEPKTSGPHVKINGYRVQIFMAGNTQQDKTKVKAWARRFKTYFPDVNAYVYFNSPHWVCEVGDYKSRYEASQMLTQLRHTHQFTSASVVRARVNSFY